MTHATHEGAGAPLRVVPRVAVARCARHAARSYNKLIKDKNECAIAKLKTSM